LTAVADENKIRIDRHLRLLGSGCCDEIVAEFKRFAPYPKNGIRVCFNPNIVTFWKYRPPCKGVPRLAGLTPAALSSLRNVLARHFSANRRPVLGPEIHRTTVLLLAAASIRRRILRSDPVPKQKG
jgi:hypothetical protein